MKLLFVLLGGAFGSGLRYLIAGAVQNQSKSVFPYGTMTVNIVGCLLAGLLGAALLESLTVRQELRIGIMVGVLGGFTTFSAFGWETMALVRDGQYWSAFANVALNNLLGLTAVWIGYKLGTWITG